MKIKLFNRDKLKSEKTDKRLREKRFSTRINPMMEREFYEFLESEKTIEKRILDQQTKINLTLEIINSLKKQDFPKYNAYLQIKLFYHKDRLERFELKKAKTKILSFDEDFEFTVKVAKEIAEKFTFNQIISATDSRGFRGIEIYGFVEINYPNQWEMLIQNGVLDKACFFAQQNYKPEYVKIVNKIDIAKYVKSPVKFREVLRFRSLPDRPFQRAVFYAPTNLREHIKWLNNYPMYVEGYRTNVILGKVSLILLGWALPDYPQILVAFTPSQNKAIFESEIESEDLRADTTDLLKKIIFYYRRENKINEMRVIEAKMEKERYEKRWSHLLDKIETENPDDPEQPRDEPKVIYTTNPIFYMVTGLLSVIIIILIILIGI